MTIQKKHKDRERLLKLFINATIVQRAVIQRIIRKTAGGKNLEHLEPLYGKDLSNLFIEMAAVKKSPIVWELGTKRSLPERSTMHKQWVPHAKQFLGIDIAPGLDVNIVADVHRLDIEPSVVQAIATQETEAPDIVISCSTFEHLDKPWIAAQAIWRAMKSDGLIFVQTHQTFPIHAYPNDMWRFTKESLSMIFRDAGFNIIDCAYQFPCVVLSTESSMLMHSQSFLNVSLIGTKS